MSECPRISETFPIETPFPSVKVRANLTWNEKLVFKRKKHLLRCFSVIPLGYEWHRPPGQDPYIKSVGPLLRLLYQLRYGIVFLVFSFEPRTYTLQASVRRCSRTTGKSNALHNYLNCSSNFLVFLFLLTAKKLVFKRKKHLFEVLFCDPAGIRMAPATRPGPIH
jgi:hypothetical protein